MRVNHSQMPAVIGEAFQGAIQMPLYTLSLLLAHTLVRSLQRRLPVSSLQHSV